MRVRAIRNIAQTLIQWAQYLAVVFFALRRLPGQAQIDGLKDSLFDPVSFSEHGAGNPWQITGSVGLTFKDVQPPPL
ncbi:hypothetical protein [Pseudomonas fluorescens]|uniref:hypothetical protein n=1 Tax=Pseudomonas fluorescens TaxID=294 RepID=UPI00177C434D|nr:hypothetical protein [Pseudomonas fluorescens]